MPMTLEEWLNAWAGARVVFVGAGHILRGDDGAGPMLAQRLTAMGVPGCIDAGSSPERHTGVIARAAPEAVLFMDAADFGGRPGAYAVFGGGAGNEPSGANVWRALGPTIDILRQQINCQVFLLGIQPVRFTTGAPLSPESAQAVEEIAALIYSRRGTVRSS